MSDTRAAHIQAYLTAKSSAKTGSQVAKIFKGVTDASKGVAKGDLVGALGGATSAAGNGADALTLRMTGLVFGEFSKSMSMGKALNMTPGKAGLFISVVVFDKVIKAAGVMDTREFSACQKALASLAADLALGVISLPTGWAIPFALASIGFSASDMSNQCIVPRMN